jgi:flagellar protein FlgJ
MQQANFKDPLFGSDQGDLYQDMYDDQIAAVMSKGKGLGLADMLVKQLRLEGAGGADSASASNAASGTKQSATETSGTRSDAIGAATRLRAGTSASTGTTGTGAAGTTSSAGTAAITRDSAAACPTSAQQAAFAHTLWPEAQRAAQQLGVNPVTLLAQAALETNWGRNVPQDVSGGTSNNLFGIKAGSGWSGAAVSNSTQEYSGGIAGTVTAQFRAYDSAGQCFQDYVDLLKSSPRYAAALGTGNDVQAFGSALQQGGYATDPAYASKLTAVAGTLARALTQGSGGSLKFAASLPTNDGSGTLQRR